MSSGIYSALSGNLAKMHALEVFTNNLTNANTNGFKRDRFAFEAVLSGFNQTQKSQGINYTRMQQSFVDFAPGNNHKTEGNLDLAINGEGFFKVQDQDGGEFLSRQGEFHLDGEGNLLNSFNMKVLSKDSQGMVIPPSAQEIFIDDLGKIFAEGENVGQIAVYTVEDLSRLKKSGNGLFEITPSVKISPDNSPGIQQGALESSNVNLMQEMALMMDGMRSFEAYQKVLKTYGEIGDKGDELGSVG